MPKQSFTIEKPHCVLNDPDSFGLLNNAHFSSQVPMAGYYQVALKEKIKLMKIMSFIPFEPACYFYFSFTTLP